MLRIAVQAKGHLYEETMNLLAEAGIRFDSGKRTLLVPAKGFLAEVLFLRDDDIPQAVADVDIVGDGYAERRKNAEIDRRLGFSRCRLSLALPKDEDYKGFEWFNGKTIATSYPLLNMVDTQIRKNHTQDINYPVITSSISTSCSSAGILSNIRKSKHTPILYARSVGSSLS